MTTTARARAQREQLQASDPAVSAFVAASAGSGKTKLLTDRLLRLMLTGANPARIQCLTFTKAAAAEMALRLQKTLGEWVTLDDAALDARLRALEVTPSEALRRQARALFATVLDLPGGMRIGTIHAFCQSLLRRFPLEAQLSPHFSLVDDTDAGIALRAAREDMLASAHTERMRGALEDLAGLATTEQFATLVGTLQSDRDRLQAALRLGPAALDEAQRRALGAHGDDALILAGAVAWPAEAALRDALLRMQQGGSPGVVAKAGEMLGWLGLPPEERAENWHEWCALLQTKEGKPAALSRLVNEALAKRHADLRDCLAEEQARIAALEDARRALRVAAVSAALVTLAAPVVEAYARRKDGMAQLDYDDLIGRTSRLLVDPGAAWVLYKLDGGLDHLLLDEVQDTAPAQWEIAGALTQEFFAGTGAREAPRSVFAVGDRKQSIYSFQGADPDQFERWRAILRQRVRQSGQDWRDVELDVSFRSTAPVLGLVDAVFADPVAAAGVAEPGKLRHIADRADHAGRVELWPLAPQPDPATAEPWTVPDANLGTVGAPQRLADALAAWIAARCGHEDLPSKGRKLAPGDVLVLVRRRNAFARALVRALKAKGVPVAGLDRLVLTEQAAVADLLALCDTLLLPADDLSLACVLTSPLGGLDDAGLMELAAARSGSLWDALRQRADERGEWRAAHGFIATLLARVDYASPHALLAEALGPLGGRARLFARLGPEAAEPVDELLNAALTYAQSHPPSLQGFVQWLRQSGAEVKREAEGAGAAVRIMTVHGAKGLQAPLVILPDTTALPPDDGPLLWAEDTASNADVQVPLWSPRKELRCAAIDTLRAESARRREEEHNRLLYVALTRAEDRLIVCGWQNGKGLPDACWYELARRGFLRLGAAAAPFDAVPDAWEGELLSHDSAQRAAPDLPRTAARTGPMLPLPAWAGAAPAWIPAPPPAEPALPSPLAPSRPENAGLGSVPQAASPLAERDATGQRFRRGQFVHTLLQHLPGVPPAQRMEAALRFLARPGNGIPEGDIETLAGEVLAVLDHPDLAPLFGPSGRAEVPLTGVVAGTVIGGLVDRLAVLPDRVLIADYKTNRAPPAQADGVPVLYLRQMAAYRAVLRAVFPERAVTCALVWTTGARVMPLPDSVLDRHAPGAQAPS
ncbi:double-strand break repair helicase AddA [Limobrevibacterium gyesilva]|uniref:DNA 3'-5' helicase n=1 Tax=Limobrevibacterium gyesilva TaxID=2991712 RepID=A0AA42CG59_9PROT|nr:double-strand break repair helicase AddA [Limobrevibacterium gyesilva]MCW3477813.1 double-strand break repair helicase AddA [Limobrevibacterium gyesilva]